MVALAVALVWLLRVSRSELVGGRYGSVALGQSVWFNRYESVAPQSLCFHYCGSVVADRLLWVGRCGSVAVSGSLWSIVVGRSLWVGRCSLALIWLE